MNAQMDRSVMEFPILKARFTKDYMRAHDLLPTAAPKPQKSKGIGQKTNFLNSLFSKNESVLKNSDKQVASESRARKINPSGHVIYNSFLFCLSLFV